MLLPLFCHLLPSEEETEAPLFPSEGETGGRREVSGSSLTKEDKDLSQQLRGTQLITKETFKNLGTLVASQGPGYLGSQLLYPLSHFLTTIC